MDGSVLAVLAAYQNNLVTSKMMTSQVALRFPTSTSGNTTLNGKELKPFLQMKNEIFISVTNIQTSISVTDP